MTAMDVSGKIIQKTEVPDMEKDKVVNELEKLNNRQREAVVWLIKNFGLLKQLVYGEPIDDTKAYRQAEANDDDYLASAPVKKIYRD